MQDVQLHCLSQTMINHILEEGKNKEIYTKVNIKKYIYPPSLKCFSNNLSFVTHLQSQRHVLHTGIA